jgi:hypothetical protein
MLLLLHERGSDGLHAFDVGLGARLDAPLLTRAQGVARARHANAEALVARGLAIGATDIIQTHGQVSTAKAQSHTGRSHKHAHTHHMT